MRLRDAALLDCRVVSRTLRVLGTLTVAVVLASGCSSGGGGGSSQDTVEAPSRFCLVWSDYHELRERSDAQTNAVQAETELAQLQAAVNELVGVAPSDYEADVAEMKATIDEQVAVNQALIPFVNDPAGPPPDLVARADAVESRLAALDVLAVATHAFESCGPDDAADPAFALGCAYDRTVELPPEPRPLVVSVGDPDQVIASYVEDTPGAVEFAKRSLPEDQPDAPAAAQPTTTAADGAVAPPDAAPEVARSVEYALLDEDGRAVRIVVLSPVDDTWIETASFTCV